MLGKHIRTIKRTCGEKDKNPAKGAKSGKKGVPVKGVDIPMGVGVPAICHNHHNRWLCKKIQSSVKFSNWNAKETALILQAQNV